MVLVVGSTGRLGSEVCRQLAAEGEHVRAMVRYTSDRNKVADLRTSGVEFMYGDLKDYAGLRDECHDVKCVICTANAMAARQPGDTIEMVDHFGVFGLIDAAKRCQVERFVYISFRPHPTLQFPLGTAKRLVEEHLQQSGLAYTILHSCFFQELWLSPALGFDYANAQATLYGDGRNRLSWVSYRDVARLAVLARAHPAAVNATLEIGGPSALSPLEAVRIFEEVGGRPFKVEHVPVNELRDELAGAPDPILASLLGLQLYYADGYEMNMAETLRVFPLQLTSVREHAQRVLEPLQELAAA